jgi:hypothetical protein
MPDIECPGCGTVTRLDTIGRTADEFCPKCDYPLFWAPAALAAPAIEGGPLDTSLRRLPGTAGRTMVATIVCPTCAEPNPVRNELCHRCRGILRPEPEPEPAPAPPPPPPQLYVPPPPPPPPPPKRLIWPWVLLVLLLMLAAVWIAVALQ